VFGEVAGGAGEERGAGGALLIGEDLGVGQPGMVVDQRVDVVEAEFAGAVAAGTGCGAAVGSPAAAVGCCPPLSVQSTAPLRMQVSGM
jgi:hypothetical protein